jgi:hypothetical protein
MLCIKSGSTSACPNYQKLEVADVVLRHPTQALSEYNQSHTFELNMTVAILPQGAMVVIAPGSRQVVPEVG